MTPQQALANLDAMRKAWEARGEVHDVMREAIAVLGRMVENVDVSMRKGDRMTDGRSSVECGKD